jgi:outer membrane murein-binding lipoprotein Lpp
MKRFLMLVGVAVVAAAMYVAAGSASQQSKGVSPKAFKALQKQVASLSKELKTVKAEAQDADGFIQSCLVSSNSGVLPINEFGDPAGTFGYQYFDGTQTVDTTALDVDLSTPFQGAYIQGVDPACVSTAARHHLTNAGHLLLRGEHTR